MSIQRTFLHCFMAGLIACAAATMALAGNIKSSNTGAKRILILTVKPYLHTPPRFIKAQIEQDSRMRVEVLDDLTKFAATDLSSYAAVVLNFARKESKLLDHNALDALSDYVHEGGGLVAVHWASAAFPKFQEAYGKLIGRIWGISPKGAVGRPLSLSLETGEQQQLLQELRERGQELGERGIVASIHDPYDLFTVRITRRDHPITQGLDDFQTVDELYYDLIGNTPIEILAEATSKVNGKVYPMAFTLTPGKGRVFHTPLGHKDAARVPATGQLLRRGTAWAAGLDPQ